MTVRYSRVAFVREGGGGSDSGSEVLMQKLDSGKYIFPGGLIEPQDSEVYRKEYKYSGSVLTGACREILEESMMLPEQSGNLYTLLTRSQKFEHAWDNAIDFVFIVDWTKSPTGVDIPNRKDPEIISMHWIKLKDIVDGLYKEAIYNNTYEECVIINKAV